MDRRRWGRGDRPLRKVQKAALRLAWLPRPTGGSPRQGRGPPRQRRWRGRTRPPPGRSEAAGPGWSRREAIARSRGKLRSRCRSRRVLPPGPLSGRRADSDRRRSPVAGRSEPFRCDGASPPRPARRDRPDSARVRRASEGGLAEAGRWRGRSVCPRPGVPIEDIEQCGHPARKLQQEALLDLGKLLTALEAEVGEQRWSPPVEG